MHFFVQTSNGTLIWNSQLRNNFWCPSCTTHITCFCFPLKLICLYYLETLTIPLHSTLQGEGFNCHVSLQQWDSDHILAQGAVAFENTKKNKDCNLSSTRMTSQIIAQSIILSWVNNILYLSSGMSYEDGSWTIWMHFSSFITYIFEILDFRCTLILCPYSHG